MKARRRGALSLVVVLLSSFLVLSPSPAQAACASTSEVTPVFHDVTVNQGLDSSSAYGPLVRGKQTVVRFYLSQPACVESVSTQRVEIKSAVLTVSVDGSATQIPADNLSTPATPVLFTQGPAPDGPGDPLFIVPGSALDPAGTEVSTASFSMNLTYRVINAGKTTDNLTTTIFEFSNGDDITAPVAAPTLPLKVLSVPLGTPNRAISSRSPQFSTAAGIDAIDGFATLARLYPVRDSAGDLTNMDMGVRYSLNTGALLDVSDAFTQGTAPNKKFCGANLDFTRYVQPRLYAYLHEYNTKQALASQSAADRVMGLLDQALNAGCAAGWAGVGSPESWVSTSYDIRDAEGNVTQDILNRIGSVMGMEVAHNAGAVPCGINVACVQAGVDRDNQDDPTHSASTNADGASPMRAYNTITGSYLDGASVPPVNRTVMKSQGKGWENDYTLFEFADWQLLLCNLGGPLTPDCGFYPQTGASAGSAQATFGISGTTDGTQGGTAVVESFVADDRVVPQQSGSPLTIRQLDASGNVIADATRSVPVRSVTSIHDDDETHGHTQEDGQNLYFFASVPAHGDAASYELVWSDGTVLYKRDVNRAPTFDVYLVSTPDDPIPTDGTVVDFDDDFGIGTAITDQYNESGTSTSDVTFSSTGGTPRISGSCAGVDLEALQEAVGALETPPCRLGATSSAPFSLRNNQAINSDPLTSGLTMTFDTPQSFVRMATGNGTLGTTATLTATLTDGSTISSTPEDVGLDVSSSSAVEIDTGENNIESVSLRYSTPAAEEIDDLVFARAGSTIPEVTTVIARVTDDEPNLKMTWFAECTDQSLPLEVASDPDAAPVQDPDGLYRALFTFEPSEELTCASASGSSGAIVSARVNDGVQTASADNSDDPFPETNHPPIAVISDPDTGSAVLENQGFTLYGQGVDLDEGVLPPDNMTWELFNETGGVLDANGDAPGTAVVGDDLFRVTPPPGGWPVAPGEVTEFTVRLSVTDSAGQTDSTENTIDVFKDEDNDLIPSIVEPCFNGSDNNPLDALGDSDGDSLFNYEDPNPCSADTNFKASIIEVNPNTLNIPSSSGGTFTVKVHMNGDVSTIDPASVRLSKFGGIPVTGSQYFARKVSRVSGNVLEAKFDRQVLVDFFAANPGFTGKDVPFSVAGNGRTTDPDGNPFTFSWEGADWVRVQGG